MEYSFVPPLLVPAGIVIALACGTGEALPRFCDSTGLRLQSLSDRVPNLVVNGSFERSDESGEAPAAWKTASWGLHDAQFSYLRSGRTGDLSIGVTITSHQSGDARWASEPLPIVAGQNYVYLDYYKSSAATKLVAAHTLDDGTVSYETLRTVPPSEDWAPAGVAVTPPAGTRATAVEHVLATVGNLQVDDVRFALPQPPDLETGVPNGKFEQPDDLDPALPLAWVSSVYGDNEASFHYESGHTGLGLGVSVTSYRDGEASWHFVPQPVSADTQYVYSELYKADAESTVSARWTLADGSYAYEKLAPAEPSAGYIPLRRNLFPPAGATQGTVLRGLGGVGTLQLDDVGLRASGGRDFQRALVTLTFDDSWVSDYDSALPALERHGVVATHYVITGLLGKPRRMTWAMLNELRERGHEIGAHTSSHPDLVQASDAALLAELTSPQLLLRERCLGSADHFSSPFGSYSDRTLAEIRLVYRSHRSTELGYNTKFGFDPYRLKTQSLRATTTLAELRAWLKEARARKSWLILVYHDVVSPLASQYSVTPEALDQQLAALVSEGLKVVTIQQALDELLPQLE